MQYIPSSWNKKREIRPWKEEDNQFQNSTKVLNNIIPFSPTQPYDMKMIIETVCDKNQFFELMPTYAQNIIIGFGEVEGRVIGVVAN
jgi:propionyl-CoA carboxylase beta chain